MTASGVTVNEGVDIVVGGDLVSSKFYQIAKVAFGDANTLTRVEAIAPLPASVGSRLTVVTASKTRPSDTTTYADKDVINNSDSAGTIITFDACAAATGGSGTIVKVEIDDSVNTSPPLQCELWLFNATIASSINDNAALAISDAENLTRQAVIPLYTARTSSTNNVGLTSGAINEPFKCNADAKLYGVLVAKNAYIPSSAEQFNIRLFIAQD